MNSEKPIKNSAISKGRNKMRSIPDPIGEEVLLKVSIPVTIEIEFLIKTTDKMMIQDGFLKRLKDEIISMSEEGSIYSPNSIDDILQEINEEIVEDVFDGDIASIIEIISTGDGIKPNGDYGVI